jgi:DNA-directed RNA polymerase specialized sigma24 family protein
LGRLDTNVERAAQAYEDLRKALHAFFNWRGAWAPDECADETLDRLAAKLEQGAPIADVRRFARGIARMVLLESFRRPEVRAPRADASELRHLPATVAVDPEPLRECLERCLGELPPESRDLILRYYVDQGRSKILNRRRLADELGTSESALRSRAQRVRDRLEGCIRACRSELESDTKL